MYKVREMIEHLDYEELQKLNKDLSAGGLHLNNLVKKKIVEKENETRKFCAVCQAPINPHSTSNYTLLFGPSDFKKKASFDALDCMEYFLSNLKSLKARPVKPTHETTQE